MPRVYISIGSNQEREQNIVRALDALKESFAQLILSSVYESEAVGFQGSHFYNMVVGFDTTQSLEDVFLLMRKIENENGRVRGGEKFSNRALDLDILTYDDFVGECGELKLPRYEITLNAFVLQPLAEIAAENLHPLLGRSYKELWDRYDKAKQCLWIVDFEWHGNSISKAEIKS